MRLSFWFDIIISNLAEILKQLFFVQHAWDLSKWQIAWSVYYEEIHHGLATIPTTDV